MNPKTIALCLALAGKVFAADISIIKAGSAPGEAVPASNFTGAAQVERLFQAEKDTPLSGGLVTFTAGARTHWHTHPLGQTLIVTSGAGRIQQWGGPVLEIRTGDIVRIPPETKHWHGASSTTAMSHVAIAQAMDGKVVQWMEAVSEEQYEPRLAELGSPAPKPPRSRAQELVGDITPKLAELTDQVLFGDVWARPQLGRRDRSLITVSALIAMNRPEQLRSHLALARQNGLSEEELSEAITHLAFYAGWPNAMTAAGVAKDVFKKP